jgi:hypothetical protein
MELAAGAADNRSWPLIGVLDCCMNWGTKWSGSSTRWRWTPPRRPMVVEHSRRGDAGWVSVAVSLEAHAVETAGLSDWSSLPRQVAVEIQKIVIFDRFNSKIFIKNLKKIQTSSSIHI